MISQPEDEENLYFSIFENPKSVNRHFQLNPPLMDTYDNSITRFSPNGRLFQVEYATLAVERGAAAVGIRGKDIVVLAVEKSSTTKLQDSTNVQKIFKLDHHILAAFAGLNADARVLVSKARVECQSYKLTVEDPVSVEYITRYIAEIQQKYTQSQGVRPFGAAAIIIGFDIDKSPRLYKTNPSGKYSAWKATATGRNFKDILEYLQENFPCEEDEEPVAGDDAIRIAVTALLEVVDPHSRAIEVAYIRQDNPNKTIKMPKTELDALVKSILDEREASRAKSNEQQEFSGPSVVGVAASSS